jgi:hypothetical protein
MPSHSPEPPSTRARRPLPQPQPLLVLGALVACSLALVSSSEARSRQSAGPPVGIVVSSVSTNAPRVGSSPSLAAAYAAGTTITFEGQAARAPLKAIATLELASARGWQVQARAALGEGGSFKLSWRPTATGPATVRVGLRTGARGDLAATDPRTTRIVADTCAAPPQAQTAPGDGLIIGGLYVAGPYLEGGALNPATGKAALTPQPLGCDWRPYTVAVSDGSTTLTEGAPASGGYAFSAPPGSYTLTATYDGQSCSGSGTVTAGEQTEINTFCGLLPVP